MNLFNQIKNIVGQKVNPATEETLSAIKSQTNLLTFNRGSVDIKIATKNIKLQNVAHANINPATEDTLSSVKIQTNKLRFDSQSNIQTTGFAPTLSTVVNVKDQTLNTINPGSDEKTILLRRMVKLMESQQTADANNNQKMLVDGFGNVVTGLGLSGDTIPLVTMANDYPTAITGVNASSNYLGWNSQIFKDTARDAYAKNIRKNLVFS